jgi:hypothetical protein
VVLLHGYVVATNVPYARWVGGGDCFPAAEIAMIVATEEDKTSVLLINGEIAIRMRICRNFGE